MSLSTPPIAGPTGLPRLLEGLGPAGSTMTLADHRAVHGPLPRVAGPELIELIERSGLRGRGGADFPTAIKLRSVAERRGASTVVINGSETEPASAKDRLLLTRLPHLVLDGAVLAARTVGAREVIVKVGDGTPAVARALEGAAAVREDERIGFSIVAGPEGYVTGEETAVLNFLSRGVPKPTFVPPRPYERGLGGRPTLIQNAETCAQIALIARFGSDWFRELGSERRPRLRAGHDLRRGRHPGRVRTGLRHPDDRSDRRRRRPDRAAAGAAGRRLLRHLGPRRQGDAAAPVPRGSARRRLRTGLRGADRARRERVRPARERAGDRLPGQPVRRPVRALRPRARGDRRRGRRAGRRQPPIRRRWRACAAGRPRSAAAAPATTPTARRALSRARSACSATSSTRTGADAAARARPACRWAASWSERARARGRRPAGPRATRRPPR